MSPDIAQEQSSVRVAELDIWLERVDPTPLTGGITNQNFRVEDRGRRYVVRVGSDIPVHGVVRANELAASRAAHLAGLAPGVVHAEPGITVFDFIEGHTFTPEDIVGFARQFDPQPFHVDAEAAKSSLFGALCASGWHTASVWMKRMVGYRDRTRTDALARGERPARLGPSPGFSNLKWLKPVYAGDTIAYRSTVTAKRASASRPGWGLVFHHNTGTNQHGEEVFAFDGMVFWDRRA